MVLEQVIGFAVVFLAAFVPGWCVSLGLFTKAGLVSQTERLAFSLAFGLGLFSLSLLAANQFFISIEKETVFVSGLLLSVVGLYFYFLKKKNLKKEEVVSLLPKFPKLPDFFSEYY